MILGIIQGRMTSTRLPGKVLAEIEGMPMIGRQIERLRRSRRLDHLVLATSLDPSDDPLVAYAKEINLQVTRGPLEDVLGRFGMALDLFPQAETLVRLTADCPLTDWRVVDEVAGLQRALGADYVSNVLGERTFPHGLDVEAASVAAMRSAIANAVSHHDREHVMPYLYDPKNGWQTDGLTRSPSLGHLRWTVDYPEDLRFVRHVYAALLPSDPDFGTNSIAGLAWNSSEAVS